jgi:hypothetical protein
MYVLDKKEIFQFPNAKWVLPFYCTHKDFCFGYVDFLAKVVGNYDFIKCVYGAPYCALNNGNLPINKKYDGYIEELNQWNNRKIPVWVTFSNYKATIKDVKSDEKVMKLLKALSENNDRYGLENGVIVASDAFRKFLRINYPNLKVIASVIFQTLSNSSNLEFLLMNSGTTAFISLTIEATSTSRESLSSWSTETEVSA